MYREGHIGINIILYSPIMLLLSIFELNNIAIIGFLLMVLFPSLPDKDQKIPFIQHRGFTHTIWFSLIIGTLIGSIFYGLSTIFNILLKPIHTFIVMFLIGNLLILFHLAGDFLTYAGINIFHPIGSKSSLNLWESGDPKPNFGFLFIGIIITVLIFTFVISFKFPTLEDLSNINIIKIVNNIRQFIINKI